MWKMCSTGGDGLLLDGTYITVGRCIGLRGLFLGQGSRLRRCPLQLCMVRFESRKEASDIQSLRGTRAHELSIFNPCAEKLRVAQTHT